MTNDQLTYEQVHEFLIDLRDSGATNMFGAGPYIEEHFGIGRHDANRILIKWIESFKRGEA